jgi:nitrogen fixation/metabolism regulation signal transduction histidine kinase
MSTQPLPPQTRSARRRWAAAAGLAFVAGLALVLLFMLTTATDNRALYEANYTRLLALNVAVALFLAGVIVWAVVRLVWRFRRKKFGSQLLAKIAAIFAVVGFVPGALIYGVSYQFVSRSIESWFDVRVETALNAGVSLGRTALDTLTADFSGKVRVAAGDLAHVPSHSVTLAVERLREQLSASDVQLWSASGQLLASAGDSRFALRPERPTAALLKSVRADRAVVLTEGLDDPGVPQADLGAQTDPPGKARVRIWTRVATPGFGLSLEPRFLHVVQILPPALVADALAVQQANREYQERALAREGLRRMYIGTLTLALFLSVFASVLLAAVLGNQLIRPLLLLAEGVRDVARGDLTPKLAMATRDELGGLTRAFADMTQQLADARAAVDGSMAQVNAAHANLQTILDNLTAGVVVLDDADRIAAINPGATRILRTPLAAYLGQSLVGVPGLEVLAQGVLQQFDQLGADQGSPVSDGAQLGVWQQSFEWGTGAEGPFRDGITIVARGAWLPEHKRLLVFDDVSELVSAQRAKAWGEVARRLAHEIKNPLTPIQLSAERLAMKLDGKLDATGQALLTKSVKTIVDQVDAMKRLVNEFRDYARLPAAVLVPVDLNATVRDVLALYDRAVVPVRADLAPDCPPIAGDAQQIRQVIHNLVQNAQDAMGSGNPGGVCVTTRRSKTGQRVRLTVLDQGPGFADHILKRAFEPYVTTKVRGTGLGLAVVKKIVDEHGARIELSNQEAEGRVLGGQVAVSFAVAN